MPKPPIEYRASGDVATRTGAGADTADGFAGYASTFWVVDSYGTAFAPGAFKRSVALRKTKGADGAAAYNLPVLWNHNPDWAVGKHLAIAEDERGLAVDIGIADDGAEGTTLLSRLRFGVPLGMSFGFQTRKDRSAHDADPLDFAQHPGLQPADVRVITEVAYWESSAVTFPANQKAAIDAVRSELELDALSAVLAEIKAGTVSDARRALLSEIVAAWVDAPAPVPTEEPRTAAPVIVRRIDAAAALARWGHLARSTA